jgi:hypothetical protein
MRPRILRSSGLAFALAVLTAGGVSATDCFNNSRSNQGNLSVSAHSPNWVSIGTLTELYSTPPDPSIPALTPSQIEWAVSEALAAGIPDSITLFIRDVLAEGTPASARLGANGRGIDYLSGWFPTLIDIYLRALQR